jgi:hypothetical protein
MIARRVSPQSVLEVVVESMPAVLVPTLQIVERLDVDESECREIIGEAESREMVRTWPAFDSVLMHEEEAERRGLEIFSPNESPINPQKLRWYDRGRGPAEHSIGLTVDPDSVALANVEDERGEPDRVSVLRAIDQRRKLLEAPRKTTRDRQDWGDFLDRIVANEIRIHATVGLGKLFWVPGDEVGPSEPCEVCGCSRLDTLSCCLGCCRSGLDGVLPKLKQDERPKYRSKAYKPDSRGLLGGK